jgi:hypothetical protein
MTHSIRRLLPAAVALAGFALFANTLAPGTVFGDPTAYALVPHLWGILHPPGYAFMTLLVKLWQPTQRGRTTCGSGPGRREQVAT